MNWGSAGEFFAMGGYGLFVWGSFGMSALLLCLEPWLAQRRHRRARDAARGAQEEFAIEPTSDSPTVTSPT